jgi:hypothetical protein
MPLPGYLAKKPTAQRQCRRALSLGYAGVGGTDNLFLLRTACVSSVPTESSHASRAAMLGQLGCGI